jgi:SSS family solute:Na+ symporter
VPLLHQTAYIAVTAFVINIVVSVVLTAVFRAVRLPAGHDATRQDNYTADPEEAPAPVPAGAGSAA